MNNTLVFLPPAKKFLKKIKDQKLRDIFKIAFENICKNPTIGQEKTGDLNGVYAYGFRYKKVDYRIAYKVDINEDNSLTIIIMVGTHENFYNELKKYLN